MTRRRARRNAGQPRSERENRTTPAPRRSRSLWRTPFWSGERAWAKICSEANGVTGVGGDSPPSRRDGRQASS